MPNALDMQVRSLPELIAAETWRLEDRLRTSVPTPVQLAIRHLVLTGCGDSGIAGQATEQTFRSLTGIPTVAVDAMTAARFLLPVYDHQYPRTPVVLAISSSGEVARVVEAARQARAVGGYVVGLTANPSSRLAEASDTCLNIGAPTFPTAPGMRSYVMAVLALSLYAVRFAEVRGRITMDQALALRSEIAALADVVHEVIEAVDGPLRQLAADWADLPCIEFLGSGPARASAAFGAAKILESTGQYACGVDVEEFVHANYFARAARRTGTVLLAPPGSPAAGRAEEVGRYLDTLQRPWVAIGKIDSAPLQITLPHIREELGTIVHAAVLGLLAAHLMATTGETPGRGSVGPWADSAGGATARNSDILLR